MSLVLKIQSLCERHNTSIPVVEKALGFGKGSMYKWDKNSPSIDKLLKVADYFNVTLDELMNRRPNHPATPDSSPEVSPADMELLEKYKNSPDEIKETIDRLANYGNNSTKSDKKVTPFA